MVHRHAPGALAMAAFAVRWVERLHVGGRKLQLRDVAVEQDEMLLAQQDLYGRSRSTSPSGPPVHVPRFRIATGEASEASEPSAQRRCRCVSLRNRQHL